MKEGGKSPVKLSKSYMVMDAEDLEKEYVLSFKKVTTFILGE